MTRPNYTDLVDMQAWARGVMQREPDFLIGEAADPYMRRWWVVPRNEGCNVYLHEILRSDDDRALHDHPWDNTSMLLEGSYIEHTAEGEFLREAGWMGTRRATDAHRLEVMEGGRAISLFFTGPKVREWGFLCPKGWVHWRDFTAGEDGQLIGRGCGEHDNCKSCSAPILSGELCKGCAAGNDPFVQSKYSECGRAA